MRILRETSLLCTRRFLETLRQPVWLLSGLIAPLLYIALFSPLLQSIGSQPREMADVLHDFVPGMLALLAFSSGTGAGWTIVWELKSGVIERFRVTPVSRFSILMGTVIRDVLAFAASAVPVVFVSRLLGFKLHIGGLALALVLLCMLTAVVSAWSQSLGLLLKEIGSVASVVTTLQLPLTLLSGALLPISLGPDWLKAAAHASPLYYAVEASRTLGSGVICGAEVLRGFGVLLPLSILTLWWATTVYRKAVA